MTETSYIALIACLSLAALIGWWMAIRAKNSCDRAVNKLQEREREYETLSMVAEKTADGVLICSPDGTMEWANENFFTLAGYTSMEDLLSRDRSITKLQQISTFPDINEAFESFQRDGISCQYDSYHVTRSGSLVWTSGTLTPVYRNNELYKVVAVYSDITDRKKVEDELRKYSKNVTDSIQYAKQIQEQLLPKQETLDEHMPDNFVVHIPKDIVSGDFRWFAKVNDHLIFATGDCTGHGVPGAFMSLMGNEYLHQIVNSSYITRPDQALLMLDKMVSRSLSQTDSSAAMKDGMDIALCAINLNNNLCQFAGVMNPLYLIRKGDLMIFDPVNESIGGYRDGSKDFISHEITLIPGDQLYMFTDGFLDQFGGPKNRKIGRTRFRELLLSLADKPMKTQGEEIEAYFNNWKGDQKQLDDVMVVGFRVH